ncbi:uncharacterized protein V6R79_025233 [Siganus canaliculatus]
MLRLFVRPLSEKVNGPRRASTGRGAAQVQPGGAVDAQTSCGWRPGPPRTRTRQGPQRPQRPQGPQGPQTAATGPESTMEGD